MFIQTYTEGRTMRLNKRKEKKTNHPSADKRRGAEGGRMAGERVVEERAAEEGQKRGWR
jgi:hypothetical protein